MNKMKIYAQIAALDSWSRWMVVFVAFFVENGDLIWTAFILVTKSSKSEK